MVALDIVTKVLAVQHLKDAPAVEVISGILEFKYIENPGMAWGLFGGARWFFVAITVVAIIVLGYMFCKIPRDRKYRLLLIDLVILTAGAIGNMIDRIFLGYVRDFIAVKFIDFPIFNVADIYATVAMFGLIILVLFVYKEDDDFAFMKLR